MLLLSLLPLSALAYETDNLTERDRPLEDLTKVLNGRVDLAIREAIAATNTQTACQGTVEVKRQVLAYEIHVRTATDQLVLTRGVLRAAGFDMYSAWIETSELDRRAFLDRTDIYGSLTPQESSFLRYAGVCSTVKVAGQILGTDKLDHFFEEGYNAWKKGEYGADPERAWKWTTQTELGIYGLHTSKTFSFADLRADHDGFMFYDRLLTPTSVVGTDANGCAVQRRGFDWAEWVNWEYDEVLNPSVHTELVQQGITRHLQDHRDEYCTSYEKWGGADYQRHLAWVLTWRPPYVSKDAPTRTDPYNLSELCADAQAEN